MSATARATPSVIGDALIEQCQADFTVTAPRGPMSSPEGLLNSLRQNLLPVLSEVLEAPEWHGFDLSIAHIDIDLGDWPDDPVWSDVRYVFAMKLRAALEQHLPQMPRQGAAAALQSGTTRQRPGAADASLPNPPTGRAGVGGVDMDRARATSGRGAEPLPGALSNRPPDRLPAASPRPTASKTAQSSTMAEASATDTTRTVAHDPSGTPINGSVARDTATPSSPESMGGASETTASASLADPKITDALAVFQQWLEKQERDITVAGILSHLAAHPAQVRGLVVWQAADPGARQKALPAAAERPAVVRAAVRLAAHATPAHASPVHASQPAPLDRKSATAGTPPPQNAQPAASKSLSEKNAPGLARGEQFHGYHRDALSDEAAHDPVSERPVSRSPATTEDAAQTNARPRHPGEATGAHPKTETTGHSGPYGGGPRAQGPTSQTQETGPVTRPATGAALFPALRGSGKPALDQIETALVAPEQEGRAMPAAARRLMASFRRAGFEEEAARAATRSIIVRLQKMLPSTDPLEGSLPVHEQGGGGADAPVADRFDRPRDPALSGGTKAGSGQGTDTELPGADNDLATGAPPTPAHKNPSDRHDPGPKEMPSPAVPLNPLSTLDGGTTTPARFLPKTPDQADLPQGQADARPQVPTASLQALAEQIATDPKRPALAQLAQAFERTPDQIFERAARSGDLAALAQLFAEESITTRPALTLLGPDQIRRLAVENPVALTAAVSSLSQAEAISLVRWLLPAEAALLRAQMEALPITARAPRAALQRAALALLQNAPLDIEALVNAGPAEATKGEVLTPPLRGPTDQTAPAAQTSPDAAAPETPLQTVLALSGLTKAEIDRVLQRDGTDAFAAPATEISSPEHRDTAQAMRNSLGPGLASAPPSDAGRVADTGSNPNARTEKLQASDRETRSAAASSPVRAKTTPGPETLRDDASLRAHLALLAGQEEQGGSDDTGDMLRLIWQLWPGPAERLASDFALLLATINAQITPGTSITAKLEAALPLLEPDTERHLYALRTVAARLAHAGGPDLTGLRGQTKATVEALIAPRTARRTPEPPAKPHPQRAPYTQQTAATAAHKETLLVTENAGLVLLHPYFALLFERLKIARDGKTIRRDDLPRALGALQFLAGDTRLQDPFHCVLLGVTPSLPLPDPQAPDDSAQALMTGLLRSVIDNWGRLGKTSPDGLRETFLQRTGSLRLEETGSRLRVAAGPFDMLLDVLPWAIGTVRLPWMPLPCHVSWREDSDA